MITDTWIDDLRMARNTRLFGEAEKLERERKQDDEEALAIRGTFPRVMSQMGHAAVQQTEHFREGMGFSRNELDCAYTPGRRINVYRFRSPAAAIVMSFHAHSLKIKVERTGEASKVAVPQIALRVVDGELQVLVDGVVTDPEAAISDMLRPFFVFLSRTT